MAAPVWFITGCSSGLGAKIALTALKAGHRVIASSRSVKTNPAVVSEVRSLGGSWIEIDVSGPKLAEKINTAIDIYGHIDVLVNNAGISVIGPLEDGSTAEDRRVMDTNFFGPLNIIRLLLPSMRARKSGTIVNISSSAGLVVLPSCGIYAASKHALEGATEALAQEVGPLGIRTLLIEPGGFRTSFIKNIGRPHQGSPVNSAYEDTMAGKIVHMLNAMDGKQLGDPVKAAQAIFDVVTRTGLAKGLSDNVLRVPLGSDCANRIIAKLDRMQILMKETQPIWESTDAIATDTFVVDRQ